MKVIQKILIIFLILVSFIYVLSPVLYATQEDIKPNDFKLKDPLTYEEGESFFKIGISILGVLRALAAIVAIVSLSIVGFQYMIGSLEEKAQYKEKMVPIAIGAVLVGGISTILISIYNIMK